MIQFKNTQLIHEVGRRENNEDSAGYLDQAFYVLCDGVGGNDKGEIASNTVVTTLLNLAAQGAPFSLQEGLLQAEQALSIHTQEYPEGSNMATTLVIARPVEAGVEVGWVGDSRLYHFRQGNIRFQTRDHSWVNEAVDAGILTAEQAIGHPRRNVITRAVRGMDTHATMSTTLLTDIQEGDLFLLCSDGVLEAWSDANLSALAFSEPNPASFTSRLKAECALHSKDNFTALVFEVAKVPEKLLPVDSATTAPAIQEQPASQVDERILDDQTHISSTYKKDFTLETVINVPTKLKVHKPVLLRACIAVGKKSIPTISRLLNPNENPRL